MIVKTEPTNVISLITYLAERPDTLVQQVGDDEVAVSFLGSRRAANAELELELRLRPWTRRRNASADILLAA